MLDRHLNNFITGKKFQIPTSKFQISNSGSQLQFWDLVSGIWNFYFRNASYAFPVGALLRTFLQHKVNFSMLPAAVSCHLYTFNGGAYAENIFINMSDSHLCIAGFCPAG
jgi:hypothetical protein